MRNFHLKKAVGIMIASVCVLVMVLSVMPATVLANQPTSDLPIFEELGQKEATALQDFGKYEVTVSVPGAFSNDFYNEIIVMVDASTSQSGNFGSLKNMLHKLGESFLINDPSVRLTLMGFGVGPRLAGSFYSIEELDAFLSTATQDDLLQERSSTNCEVGFEFINTYIKNSPKLNKAHIIFTSDGGINLDETPLNWSKWEDTEIFAYLGGWNKDRIITYVVDNEENHISKGYAPLSVTANMFPNECAAIAKAKEQYGISTSEYEATVNELSIAMAAKGVEYLSAILEQIHITSDLTWGESYSAATMEKAFQTYFRACVGVEDANYSSYMDFYYLILGKTGYNKLTNKRARTVEASKALQQNEKVVDLIHVGYSGANSTWMNPENNDYVGFNTEKLTYIYNSKFSDVTETLIDTSQKLTITGYKDVTITDPMSKWVILDETSICIYNGNTKIYENGKWLTDDIPAQNPITIITNDDGHREISWRVKDGWLLFNDRYYLRYTVTLDEPVEGFEYGKEYPANDPTYVTYKDPDDEEKENPIEVPNIKEENPNPPPKDDNPPTSEPLPDEDNPPISKPEDTDDKSDTPQSPQTGDTTNIMLWISLMVISGLGVILTSIYGKIKSH